MLIRYKNSQFEVDEENNIQERISVINTARKSQDSLLLFGIFGDLLFLFQLISVCHSLDEISKKQYAVLGAIFAWMLGLTFGIYYFFENLYRKTLQSHLPKNQLNQLKKNALFWSKTIDLATPFSAVLGIIQRELAYERMMFHYASVPIIALAILFDVICTGVIFLAFQHREKKHSNQEIAKLSMIKKTLQPILDKTILQPYHYTMKQFIKVVDGGQCLELQGLCLPEAKYAYPASFLMSSIADWLRNYIFDAIIVVENNKIGIIARNATEVSEKIDIIPLIQQLADLQQDVKLLKQLANKLHLTSLVITLALPKAHLMLPLSFESNNDFLQTLKSENLIRIINVGFGKELAIEIVSAEDLFYKFNPTKFSNEKAVSMAAHSSASSDTAEGEPIDGKEENHSAESQEESEVELGALDAKNSAAPPVKFVTKPRIVDTQKRTLNKGQNKVIRLSDHKAALFQPVEQTSLPQQVIKFDEKYSFNPQDDSKELTRVRAVEPSKNPNDPAQFVIVDAKIEAIIQRNPVLLRVFTHVIARDVIEFPVSQKIKKSNKKVLAKLTPHTNDRMIACEALMVTRPIPAVLYIFSQVLPHSYFTYGSTKPVNERSQAGKTPVRKRK